jgi:hypothetical protein
MPIGEVVVTMLFGVAARPSPSWWRDLYAEILFVLPFTARLDDDIFGENDFY